MICTTPCDTLILVIIMQFDCDKLELQSLVEYFYAIDGVPAKAVKMDDLHYTKIFIQSTSQGSRCLRKGEKILYLKEVNNAVYSCTAGLVT